MNLGLRLAPSTVAFRQILDRNVAMFPSRVAIEKLHQAEVSFFYLLFNMMFKLFVVFPCVFPRIQTETASEIIRLKKDSHYKKESIARLRVHGY